MQTYYLSTALLSWQRLMEVMHITVMVAQAVRNILHLVIQYSNNKQTSFVPKTSDFYK